MRRFSLSMTVILTAVAATSPARAAYGICHSLWVERAAIYKDAGLCFKTARAINYFGNAGCRYDDEADVPLTPREIARVEKLFAQERAHRCDGSWRLW